jgi:serine/threonine kinase 38
MLVGYPPFFSDEPSITCQKIIHWKKTLVIPPDANLSPAATDLIKRLICEAPQRLGSKGATEIKNHPFFEGMDWDNLRAISSPYIPEVN